MWGGDPPGGARSPLEDVAALRARMGSAAEIRAGDAAAHKMYQDVTALKNENAALRRQVDELTEYKRNAMDLQQKLLKAEADNSILHESLRDAQDLIEEAMVDVPGLESKLDDMRTRVRTDTQETRRLSEALRAAQHRAATLEADLQGLHSLAGVPEAPDALATWIATSKQALADPTMQTPEPRAGYLGQAHPPTVQHPMGGRAVASAGGGVTPARIQRARARHDPAELQALVDELLQELQQQGKGQEHGPLKTAPMGDDGELLGGSWNAVSSPDDKLALYRGRLKQSLAELAAARDEIGRLHKTIDASGRPHAEALVKELTEYRTEVGRLREDKQRLMKAVEDAALKRQEQEELLAKRFPDEASSEMSFEDPHAPLRPAEGIDAEAYESLMDQLVAARAAAQAAELLKHDQQDERRSLLAQLDTARNQIVTLQSKLDLLPVQPAKIERGESPIAWGVLDTVADSMSMADMSVLDVTPAFHVTTEDKKEVVDEFALESLRHVLQQTQQLLERSDQQLLEERDGVRGLKEEMEELRVALETTLKEATVLQEERNGLATERDQWAQAARDADDARRKLVEHIELYQASSATQGRDAGKVHEPEVTELMREKAELLVQIDILKERLADSMEELEGARRELVNSLAARGELQRQQDTNAELLNTLRETETEKDKIEQEKGMLEEEANKLRYQLENANLVKTCSNEKLEKIRRENEEMRKANATLKKEMEDQMKEMAFLCDTLTETSAQYEESTRKLEQTDSERNSLLEDKHKDLQRIEELSGKLTQVRLQNDREAIQERKQLQQERELDAMILAERMKELQDLKDEMAEVKARASKAINILKVSLQNSLLQMKTLGDEFEMDKAARVKQTEHLQEHTARLEKENERLRAELSQMMTKEGTDRLKEKVALLSDGLKETRERFAEQTQAYEKSKSQLKAVAKQLSNNASYKPLFDEANETIEALMAKNQEYQRENARMREQKDDAVVKAKSQLEEHYDEDVKDLRSQILALQAEVKREKSLRVRQKEQHEHAADEQNAYESQMTALIEEITEKLDESNENLRKAEAERDRLSHELVKAEAARGSSEAPISPRSQRARKSDSAAAAQQAAAMAELEGRVETLRVENTALVKDCEQLQQDVQKAAASTEAKVKAAARRGDVVSVEYRTILRSLQGLYGVVRAHVDAGEIPAMLVLGDEALPNASGEEEDGGVIVPPAVPVMEQMGSAVKIALERMKAKLGERVASAAVEVGTKQAELETLSEELSARLRQAEYEKAAAQTELNTVEGEMRVHREQNLALREEVVKLEAAASSGNATARANEQLKAELKQGAEQREKLLADLNAARRDQTEEFTRLSESLQRTLAEYDALQKTCGAAEDELATLKEKNVALDQMAAQLTKSLDDAGQVASASEKRVHQAVLKCDEAVRAKDMEAKEKLELSNALDAVRKELVETKTDFGRLQAVCQDLDSLNQMVDDTQDELAETKKDLETTRAELQRMKHMREHDIETGVATERAHFRDQLTVLQAERDMFAERADALKRDNERAALGTGRELTDAKDRVQALEGERVRMEDRLAAAEAATKRKTEEIARHEAMIASLERNVLDLEQNPGGSASPRRGEEFEAVRKEIAANRDAMAQLQDTLEAREAEVAQLLMKNSSLAAALQSQEAMKAKDLFAAEHQTAVPLDSTHLDALRHLEDQLAILRAENDRVRADRDGIKKELEEGREIMLALVGPLEGRTPAAAAQ
eukprot:TRINITY_DN19617_c0_g1_i1.p1 TRINITY_DN19617_c0_g1~~TRINITY_DN19617_c0_g1_i1.p1  ORF type:complete len:1737 (+),score=827.90 TRINITY_DN19617_c0_g1_i1:36-5246(+)